MTIATGLAKQLRFKAESTWGTAAGASGAQLLRRVSSSLGLKKQTYESAEIRRDYQRVDFRHGVKSIDGSISGELSAGTWQSFVAAAVRQVFATAPTTTAITTVTAAATTPHFTRSSGSFLTDGFKVGDVVRWTGFAGGSATNNNSRNFLITLLTATQMTGVFLDGTAVVADAAGDSVTCTLAGKKTKVPTTGHTDPSYSIEHYFSDIVQSELFTGCKVNSVDLKLPPTGMAGIEIGFLGKDLTTATAEYFTTPTAETSTGNLAAVNGALYVQGVAVALITGLDISIKGNMSAEPVVGSNTYPDIFEGRVLVDGNMTVFFQDATFRDYFVNETEVSLIAVLTASSSATADFLSIVLPRIKVGGGSPGDGEKGLTLTMPFTALRNTSGGSGTSSEDTTISIQDSQAT